MKVHISSTQRHYRETGRYVPFGAQECCGQENTCCCRHCCCVDKTIATAVDNTADLSSTDDEHEVHLCAGATRNNDNSSPCSTAKHNVDIQFPTYMTTCEDVLSDDISQNTTHQQLQL